MCVLFISLVQSLNEAQFLRTTSLPALSACAGAATYATVIVPLTSISVSNHDHINLTLTLKFWITFDY